MATILSRGDSGSEVKKMQKMLNAIGYSLTIDGSFGLNTEKAVRRFQADNGLNVSGKYGPKAEAKLKQLYNDRPTASKITVEQFLRACKNVMDTARNKHYKYGDSHSLPPTDDHWISCDRLIAKALWDLGFKDQRQGGEVCSTLDNYLKVKGFVRSTNVNDIKRGSILLVHHAGLNYISHAFVCVGFNPKTWVTSRYDSGSNDRIQTVQPLKNVSWGYEKTLIIYNIPAKKKKKESGWKATGTATSTYDNVLHVWSKPEKGSEALGKLSKGNRFEIDGQTSGEYTHVNVNGVIGWVKTKWVKKD